MPKSGHNFVRFAKPDVRFSALYCMRTSPAPGSCLGTKQSVFFCKPGQFFIEKLFFNPKRSRLFLYGSIKVLYLDKSGFQTCTLCIYNIHWETGRPKKVKTSDNQKVHMYVFHKHLKNNTYCKCLKSEQ